MTPSTILPLNFTDASDLQALSLSQNADYNSPLAPQFNLEMPSKLDIPQNVQKHQFILILSFIGKVAL